MNQNNGKKTQNKQTNHQALSKHKTSEEMTTKYRTKKIPKKNSISIKYIGIKCDSLKLFVYTAAAAATATAATAQKNTFVLSISFFNMKMCVPTLEQINVLLLYFVALFVYVYNASACCTTAHIATVKRCSFAE